MHNRNGALQDLDEKITTMARKDEMRVISEGRITND